MNGPYKHTLDLFADDYPLPAGVRQDWPEAARFPVNANGRRVRDTVWADLLAAYEPLIVTGYASLDRFIDYLAAADDDQPIRVLFGHEPLVGPREHYALSDHDFTAEAERYWLAHNISLTQSAALIRAIDALAAGRIRARYLAGGWRLHAKIYCGQRAATLGSSNFTRPGLEAQFEANARFEAGRDKARFAETWHIAENYWSLGHDYSAALIALLRKLLKVVNWDEALARAAAELLEGDWAAGYLREAYLSAADTLWPAQKQGIAQALYILSNQGSVLIADATGAGKTRMGAYLIGAVRDDILRKGRMRQGKALMICPPAVADNWYDEATHGNVSLDIASHGKLSNAASRRHELTVEQLRRAQILAVDEGHNFLNLASKRTQQLLRNMADHVVLLTATPINRGETDLLRVADMLGADNLSQSTLAAFDKMLGATHLSRSLTEAESNTLRAEIQTFTVRRTKKALNALIDREPDAYRDRSGARCRFPQHDPKIYPLGETERDRALAKRIGDLADGLHGVTHFVRPVELPEALRRRGVSEEQFLAGRLNSAKKLARYIVTRALRSSRAALIEHIEGTDAARREFGIEDFSAKTETGNILATFAGCRGQPPDNKLRIDLPDWLADAQNHAAATDADIAAYREIARLSRQLSGQREQSKARLLIELLDSHGLVLAFDSRPITLAVLRQRIGNAPGRDCLLVWGGSDAARAKLLKTYAHGSRAHGVIGLCSDSMAEGVNLQQASTLVHLDMPSVVRIAEQRVGRVDRLDSPHAAIEAWWPQDAPEFALTSDERFIERFDTVERLLGSNMPLPEHLQKSRRETVSAEQMIETFEAERDTWDGIDDAFAPVRNLVGGAAPLVAPDVYERYRHVTATVLSRLGLVAATAPWAFFCLTSGSFAAPRWLLLPSYGGEPISSLAEVAAALRARLGPNVDNLALTDQSAASLNRFLDRLARCERGLLPRKKQRALEEMEHIVGQLMQQAGARHDQAAVEHLGAVHKMLRYPTADRQPDWDEVAARWLDLIRPVWFEKLQTKSRKPLLLKDVRSDLLNRVPWLSDQIQRHFADFPTLPGPETRVRACIVGVSAERRS